MRRSRTGLPSVSSVCAGVVISGSAYPAAVPDGPTARLPSSLRGCPGQRLAFTHGRAGRRHRNLGLRVRAVQDAVAIYPLFAFLAVRFGISALVLVPFAWRSLHHLPRSGVLAGVGAGALLATAYGLQTAGLDLTTVSSTGFITGLYVVLTPIIALILFRTPGGRCRLGGSRAGGRGAADAERRAWGVGARQCARARKRDRPVVPDRRDGAIRAALRRASASRSSKWRSPASGSP